MTHICLSKSITIGSDNGLSPGQRQVIIWTNDGILLFPRVLGTNFGEMLSELQTFSFKKMQLKMSCAKKRQFYVGLNLLTTEICNACYLRSLRKGCLNGVKAILPQWNMWWHMPALLHTRLLATRHMYLCSIINPLPWWHHQMETFSTLLANCVGNSPVTSEFAVQRPVRQSFEVNGWINNRKAGDLRRYRAHYDITVMLWKN